MASLTKSASQITASTVEGVLGTIVGVLTLAAIVLFVAWRKGRGPSPGARDLEAGAGGGRAHELLEAAHAREAAARAEFASTRFRPWERAEARKTYAKEATKAYDLALATIFLDHAARTAVATTTPAATAATALSVNQVNGRVSELRARQVSAETKEKQEKEKEEKENK